MKITSGGKRKHLIGKDEPKDLYYRNSQIIKPYSLSVCSSVIQVTWNQLGHPALPALNELAQTIKPSPMARETQCLSQSCLRILKESLFLFITDSFIYADLLDWFILWIIMLILCAFFFSIMCRHAVDIGLIPLSSKYHQCRTVYAANFY